MAALNFSFPTSFTDLLASDDYPINTGATAGTTVTKGLGDRIAERTGSGLPKFKSFPPPSLPVSSPPVSPSSYFAFPPGLSPTMLLDSPVLLYGSNILPSPTTGTGSIFAEAFNWKNDSGNFNQVVKEEEKYQSSFSLDSRPLISESQATKIPVEQKNHYWDMQDSDTINQDGFFTEKNTAKSDYSYQQTFSPEIANLSNNSQPNSRLLQPSNNHYKQLSQTVSEKKRSEDGYNWRKYGQKQVRGSENPRSYYKCTYPNCPTRKKLERSIQGHITEIVYTGNHNHPKPQPSKRSSSSSNSSVVLHPYNVHANDTIQDSATTPDNSSVSLGDGDFAQSPEKSISIGEEFDNEEPQAKRWKRESQNECISALASKTVREARVVVQTTSDIDILDDGYRWRKYGQKAVKGNPNPRSYYKCTFPGCPVRKHVERASEDLRSVMTTYEGKHNHDVPAARGSGNSHSLIKPVPSNLNENRSTGNQVPYTLQMLQSPEMFGFTTL